MDNIRFLIEWEVVNNIAGEGTKKYFYSKFILKNVGKEDITNRGWKLYFNFVRLIYDNSYDREYFSAVGLKLKKYSGTLYHIEPTEMWKTLKHGDEMEFTFKSSDWAILKGDGPLSPHLQIGDSDRAIAQQIVIRDFKNLNQTSRYYADRLKVESFKSRYEENLLKEVNLRPWEYIVPGIREFREGSGEVLINRIDSCYFNGDIDLETDLIKESKRPNKNFIEFGIDKDFEWDEGYKIELLSSRNSLVVTARREAGLFYGYQTFLFLRNSFSVFPGGEIIDYPEFEYRGAMVDIARHFQSLETIKKYIDSLAKFKINRLHLHFCDDEGWRVEIPGLEELTEYGSRRGFDPEEKSMLNIMLGAGGDQDNIDGKGLIERDFYNFSGNGSGYYKSSEFIHLLKYAKSRFIEIIPEIDVPGHCRAAIKSMLYREKKRGDDSFRLIEDGDDSEYLSVQLYNDNVINPGLETTYKFLEKVIREVKNYYDTAGVELKMIHIGGDEVPHGVWEKSKKCRELIKRENLDGISGLKEYFFKRLVKLVKDICNVPCAGWADVVFRDGQIIDGFEEFVPMPWSNIYNWGGESRAYKLANRGIKTILSSATNLYMDLAYNKDSQEIGYYWAGFVDTKRTYLYNPLNLYSTMIQDRMGNKIDPESFKMMEKLRNRSGILGLQGLLWGENAKGREFFEYLAFPKLLGVAERAWSKALELPELIKGWERFRIRVGGALSYLDSLNINYRLPLPGVKFDGEFIHCNIRFPGLKVEYKSSSDSVWREYKGPFKSPESELEFRSLSWDGKRHSRVCKFKKGAK